MNYHLTYNAAVRPLVLCVALLLAHGVAAQSFSSSDEATRQSQGVDLLQPHGVVAHDDCSSAQAISTSFHSFVPGAR